MTTLIVEPENPAEWVIELKALASDHGGQLTPELVVDHAKKKASALHGMFTWDNTEAAMLWRLTEAGALIRRYKVRFVNRDEEEVKVPWFVNVPVKQNEGDSEQFQRLRVYKEIPRVLESKEDTAYMLMTAKRELATFRRKYSILEDLAELMTQIDKFIVS